MHDFSKHVRGCATCSATRLPSLMCPEGIKLFTTAALASSAYPFLSQPGLTERALDFVEANEFGGREWDGDGKVVHVCLDCGAQKGNPHSPEGCETIAILHAAGRR